MCRKVGILLQFALAANVAFAQQKPNKPLGFEDFPAKEYTGTVAMPMFLNVKAGAQPWPDGDPRCIGEEHGRTAFFSEDRPNFAGHWIIEKCTCGTGCAYPFMWDARSGAVYRDFPVRSIFAGDLYSNSRGLIHRVNSRLLIIESYTDEVGKQGWRSYYEWDGRRFVRLYRVALSPVR